MTMGAKLKFLLPVLVFLSAGMAALAQDTFSIIAADPDTGEIGAAGATCVDGIAQWGGIKVLNKVIPGRGGVNAQAWICLNPHINLDNAIDQMETGLSPEEIILWLQENDACNAQSFNPAFRQYGVVDFDEDGNIRTAAFTGSSADDWKGHIAGDNYAIQGNILIGEEVLSQMEAGFLETEGTLAEKLMAAMQGANIPGADSRCLERGTSSTSAFLSVYTLEDLIDQPSTLLDVMEVPFGMEPIDSLQTLFDVEFGEPSSAIVQDRTAIQLFPNPTKDVLLIRRSNPDSNWIIKINSIDGCYKQTLMKSGEDKETSINIEHLLPGVYTVNILLEDDTSITKKFIKQ